MTIKIDPITASIHQQQDHPLDQEGKGRSDKQSPNRAGIRMPRGPRLDSANGSSDRFGLTWIVPSSCVRGEF